MAKDLFHDTVKNALLKEQWQVTHESMNFQVGGVELYIDMGAEKLLAAQKGKQKIAVEVKSFVRTSTLYEFHLAIGQFRNYQLALMQQEPDRELFLAVPDYVFRDFFNRQFVQDAITFNQVKLLVYNIDQERIVKWQT